MSKPARKIQESSEAKVSRTIAAVLRNKTLEEAASELGITYRGLRKRIVKWPVIQEAINSVVSEASDKLKIAAPRAADVIVSKLDDRRQDFEAAKEVLDRAGVGSKNNGDTNIQVNVMNAINKQKDEYGI